MYKKILCGTKGSQGCKKAEERAIKLAKENGAELTFLYVVNVDFMARGGGRGSSGFDGAEDSVSKIGRIILEGAKDEAEEKGVSAKVEIRKGKPIDEIINYIKSSGTDLLVIGHISRGGIQRHMEGSDTVEEFVNKIKSETGADVMLVE